jgi:aconitate hydratase
MHLTFIYDASQNYRAAGTPLCDPVCHVIRATSPPSLVIVESFERIHRSNPDRDGCRAAAISGGESWATLGLDGTEVLETVVSRAERGKPHRKPSHVTAAPTRHSAAGKW